jgi:hypothetical protein
MSSPAVLDAALADPRIARLALFQGVADPRAALAGMFQIYVTISVAETDRNAAVNVVSLYVHSTTAVHDIADALAAAIAAQGPAVVTSYGRPITGMPLLPIGEIPWYRDWRLYSIASLALAAILVVLVLPSRAMSDPSSRPAG